MNLKLISTTNFYSSLFEKNKISNLLNNAILPNTTHDLISVLQKTEQKKAVVNSLELVPSYLNVKVLNSLKHKKTFQKEGFAVNLKDFNNVDELIKSNCSSNFRKVFNRSLNRFETSFNISYKMYFGAIEKENYDVIMNALEQMISNRFQIKTGRNKDLANWQHHYNQTFKLINEKRASLFVIYNNETPVEISLNYHIDTIMYSAISSFDLDYGKFSLGNIEIYKQLEWCLSNGVTFFDMGYGNFDYKRRWSNYVYNFENHFISKNQTLLVSLYSFTSKYKYKAIDYLISKNINDKIYGMLDVFKKKEEETIYVEPELTTLNDLSEVEIDKTNSLNINTDENKMLRKPIYDFLYKEKEHLDNIKVFKAFNDKDTYIIISKNSFVKIKF